MSAGKYFFWLCLFILLNNGGAFGQNTAYEKPRLTVAEGLPQSYISGLVQDSHGLIWVATRDGLGRYEGREFKTFRHRPGDTTSLSANVIANIFLDRSQQLWIQYDGGEIDILNTATEHLFHFTKDPVYKATLSKIKNNDAIIQDDQNHYWLLGEKGGIFIVDLQQHRLHFYNDKQLGLLHNPATGIAVVNHSIVLVADTSLIFMNANRKLLNTISYTFSSPHLFNPRRSWKDNSPVVRKNGSIVIVDEDRLIIFDPGRNTLVVKPLHGMKVYLHPCRVQDDNGNIIFSFDGSLYLLTAGNELRLWKENPPFSKELIPSLLLDRSGVLWVGTNGYDLRQFDLRLPRMPAEHYAVSFPGDILQKYLGVTSRNFDESLLNHIDPYLFRWVKDGTGKIWMSKAGADQIQLPNICYYQNGKIVTENWRYTDTAAAGHSRVSALALSPSGKLWGLDYHLHLLRFDTLKHTATVMRRVPLDEISIEKLHDINSMLLDGEDTFWITTSIGFVKYDLTTGETFVFRDILPNSAFTVLTNDPSDKNIMWIGSLGGGLIRFNKKNYTYHIYTTYDGLPNNTIYALLPVKGQFWCSSNKGIFSFDPKTNTVRSYTTLDGLPVDEFNRFHFFTMPDGRLAFGGTKGYTVFDPDVITGDSFNPRVALTGLKINNRDADYGSPASPLTTAVNSLDKLVLSYQQNFLAFEFAALEYNIPEKLSYRYIMTGLDHQWVDAGTTNSATYTNLPPGKYLFKVNATNSAGKWSRQVKTLRVIITPPFWLTWWFILLCLLLAAGLVYLFIRMRIARIRKQEQQKHHFEREVILLEAQALRAQMNPHFIFNCLNSIKALIQEDKKEQATTYLTTFSKLIRNQLSNAQQEISLYDEIQTCRLYVQLESLRFGDKITCDFFY